MAKRLDNNAILSIAAAVVSVCALVVSIYQTILMRQQQNASVWPKLIISHGYVVGAGDESFYRLDIRNVGIGPAIIRRVDIEANGAKYLTMGRYAKAVLKNYNALDSLGFDATDLLAEDVIPQGEERRLFDTNKSHLASYFIPSQNKFSMTVEYESVYGDKWETTYPR